MEIYTRMGEKNMLGTCKKLITDINRDAKLEENIPLYTKLLSRQYNCYAMVKMSMNYFTMKEVCQEQEDPNTDVCKYFSMVTDLLKKYVIQRTTVDEEAINIIKQLRYNVEYKMHNLTAYTDGYEIYEYILNRVEARVKNQVKPVDAKGLAEQMFRYVFSEQDTVVINSKLQLLMAQLPVRMTKNKFFDIVSNTLNIYEGGENTSVDEFCEMLRNAVLIKKPEGFDTEYPFLKHVYEDLVGADYQKLDEENFDCLSEKLSQAATLINNEASGYLLLQEVINDVYTVLLTIEASYAENSNHVGYQSALKIIKGCIELDDLEEIPDDLMDAFLAVEGVQEDVYESIMILESAFEDVKVGKKHIIDRLGFTKCFEDLATVGKLLSTSLFIDLDREYGTGDVANHEYISMKKDALIADFDELFKNVSRVVRRSIMCKLLATMPIFMNSKQEIKDYFEYVLDNCGDDSELLACSKLISEIIEEE